MGELTRDGDGDDGNDVDGGDGENGGLALETAASVPTANRFDPAWQWTPGGADGPEPMWPVVTSHVRLLREARVEGPVGRGDGGVPSIELSFKGESFLLHHVRHMVAVAVAAGRGVLPPRGVAASLHRSVRVRLPLAPPGTLVLSSSSFDPFDRGRGKNPNRGALLTLTGDRLGELDPAGRDRRDAFDRDVLRPAVAATLRESRTWETFVAQCDAVGSGAAQAVWARAGGG